MAENWNQGFSMPMFRSFVPEKIRPWLYVFLAFTFQLANGVYLGGMEEMRGELALKREDIMMCLYSSLCGLVVTFPILFRTKFRFTNRTLLLFSSIGIAVLSIAALYVRLVPLLWVICFFVGCLKLQGTFECMSNIQLWMTPQRDFTVFFPVLHIFIMCSVAVSDILAVYLSYYATWHYMGYLMIGVMLFNALWLWLLTRHVRTAPKMPLLAVDWLGTALWALVIIQVCFVFCYGEYYQWWRSQVIRTVTVTAIATLVLAVWRMLMIRHPYITPGIFRSKYLSKLLLITIVIEAIMATEHVLEEAFFAAGPQWSHMQRVTLNYPLIAGVLAACLFALLWLKVLQQSAVRLVGIAVAAFVAYALWFYFNIDLDINIERLYLPIALRGFANTIIGITLLLILKRMIHFMVFFQAVTIFQALHLVIAGAAGAAIYAFGMRYFMADTLQHFAVGFDATAFTPSDGAEHIGYVMRQGTLATVKRLFGLVAYVSLTTLLFVMLWDLPLVRRNRDRIPSLQAIASALKKRVSRMGAQLHSAD